MGCVQVTISRVAKVQVSASLVCPVSEQPTYNNRYRTIDGLYYRLSDGKYYILIAE